MLCGKLIVLRAIPSPSSSMNVEIILPGWGRAGAGDVIPRHPDILRLGLGEHERVEALHGHGPSNLMVEGRTRPDGCRAGA